MNLSEHFTLAEMEQSQAAARNGIDNSASPIIIQALEWLCIKILEPIRAIKGPVVISSGYRSPQLNEIVGGSSATSQHCRGEAADIIIPTVTPGDLFAWIAQSELPYDQLILEFGQWVHVSYSRGQMRKSKLIATRKPNGTLEYKQA